MLGIGLAIDRDPAGGGLAQAHDHPHRGGLAGAVRAEETGDAAGVDGEADAAHSGLVAVAFGEILRLDHADPSVCWWSPNSTAVGAADTRRPRHRSAGAERSLRRAGRSEEHTSELQSRFDLVCRLLL